MNENQEWVLVDLMDHATWPAIRRRLFLTVEDKYGARSVMPGCMAFGRFRDGGGYELDMNLRVIAWRYEEMPEPYQEKVR